MQIDSTNYGPFAPVVGYAGAIMAAGAALFLLWGGKMRKWRPPEEDLPGTAQTFVFLLCSVGMVLQWYFAVPDSLEWFLGSVALLATGSVFCFLKYSGLLGTYIYIKRIATGPESVCEVRILGGRELRPEAEKKRSERGVDVQRLLEGSAYNVDLLWSREALQWVKQRVILFFILTLVLGTSALTGASFATQVLLTRKAAASTIRSAEAPGLLP
jgi:hypothetical protein